MYNNFQNKNIIRASSNKSNDPHILITQENYESKIYERFQILNNDKIFHNYFSSYDFHSNEQDVFNFWRDLLGYSYNSLFSSPAIKISILLEYTKFKNRRPIGLPNIIKDLINRDEYFLSSDLDSDEYYKRNYNHLYKKESWSAWFKKGVISTLKLPLSVIKTKADSHTSNRDGYNPPLNELLIHKASFTTHLEGILTLLSHILLEEDVEVLTKIELERIIANSPEIKFKGAALLDLSLKHLSKTKNISIFKVKVQGIDIECIKLLRNTDDTVTEKDIATINILIQLKNFDRKMEETMLIVQSEIEKAKECLKKKNKDAAMTCMKRKNVYLRAYNHYSNLRHTLDQHLIDIKSMESNMNVKNILEDVLRTSDKLKLNVDDLDDVADRLKEHGENIKEAQGILIDANVEESFDDEINKLTEQLSLEKKEEQQNKPQQDRYDDKLPSVIHNENLNNMSLEKMLEELNK